MRAAGAGADRGGAAGGLAAVAAGLAAGLAAAVLLRWPNCGAVVVAWVTLATELGLGAGLDTGRTGACAVVLGRRMAFSWRPSWNTATASTNCWACWFRLVPLLGQSMGKAEEQSPEW